MKITAVFIEFGMVFGTGFDVGICQIITVVALKSCPSFKLILGQLVLGWSKPADSSGHQIFSNPKLQSKPRRCATPFGAGYTEYQPEIVFLDSFGEQLSCSKLLEKLHHSPGVPN